MRPLTHEWLGKAEGDYQVAEWQIQTSKPVPDVICFLCQQAVEKYLKAWLTEQSTTFPRTHDLEMLAKLAFTSLPGIATMLHDLRYLTTFGVEVRYPGTSASLDDARQAVRTASAVRDLIRGALSVE